MYNTIETGTLSGPMHSWASWNDRVQLASLPKILSPFESYFDSNQKCWCPSNSLSESNTSKTFFSGPGKRNSRFARCPLLIYPKSKCPPLWPTSVSESRACHDPPGPGQSLDDEAPFEWGLSTLPWKLHKACNDPVASPRSLKKGQPFPYLGWGSCLPGNYRIRYHMRYHMR